MGTKKSTNGHNKRARAPFLDRFTKRVDKLKAWTDATIKRLTTAPSSDIADSLGAIGDSLDAIKEAMPKLKGWTPPSRGPAFSVGEKVKFKPTKIAELVESGLYKKGTIDGEHVIEAIHARKVKLKDVGIFQSRDVTKGAQA